MIAALNVKIVMILHLARVPDVAGFEGSPGCTISQAIDCKQGTSFHVPQEHVALRFVPFAYPYKGEEYAAVVLLMNLPSLKEVSEIEDE